MSAAGQQPTPAINVAQLHAAQDTISNEYCGKGCRLRESHLDLIKASAISPEVSKARHYRSVTTKAELKSMGFAASQCNAPTLLIPLWNSAGELAGYQHRPTNPRVVDGKVVKYETAAKMRMVVDVHPILSRPRISANPNACLPGEALEIRLPPLITDPSVPLIVTEGVRKADSAVSIGLCCAALLGVWNWRGTNAAGGLTALVDWDSIALKGRDVYVAYDSDVMTKRQVHAALVRLKAFLESRGARVHVIYLPPGEHGEKVGLDDFIAAQVDAGKSQSDIRAELLALATDELRRPPADLDASTSSDEEIPYFTNERGLWWSRSTQGGTIPTPLTNFTAEILADISRDDGVEMERHVQIRATLNGRSHEFGVSASDFHSMRWVSEELGGRAIVHAGSGRTEHARCAIQMLSAATGDRTIYTHTGWRLVDDKWAYLHAGGAIGADGAVAAIETDLPSNLQNYVLPDPPQSEELKTAVRASLGLLDGLAPDPLGFTVVAGIYCPLLCDANFTIFLVGATGAFKTEIAALAQQHFGAAMVAEKLPTSFRSTANANELLAFAAKDTLLVVDEYKLSGSHADRERMQRDAEYLIRAQGNRQGRGRLRADITARRPKPPRGGLLATGEELPRGVSLRARMWIVEVAKEVSGVTQGDVDRTRLSECQRDALAGLYSRTTAGFIKWLAPRYSEVVADLKARLPEARESLASTGGHWRGKDILIKLASALAVFLDFATEVGAIDAQQQSDLMERADVAFRGLADRQIDAQQADDPVLRFVSLITSAIGSGAAHVATMNGNEPGENSGTWGWRSVVFGAGENQSVEWRPQGERIGWLDGEDLYLDPDTSYKAANRMAAGANDLDVGPQALRKRLHEAGLFKTTGYTSEGRESLMVRRSVQGRRTDVLHMRTHTFAPEPLKVHRKPDQPGQDGLPPS